MRRLTLKAHKKKNFDGEDFKALLKTRHLTGITALTIFGDRDTMTDIPVEVLSQFPELFPALDGLRLDEVRGIGDAGAEALLSNSKLHIKTLVLTGCQISRLPSGDTGFAQLERLNLEHNRLGAEGLASLARWPGLAHLKVLDVGSTGLTDESLITLLASPYLGALETLVLDTRWGEPNAPGFSAKTLEAILEAPGLGSLKAIDFPYYSAFVFGTPRPLVKRLRERFTLPDIHGYSAS